MRHSLLGRFASARFMLNLRFRAGLRLVLWGIACAGLVAGPLAWRAMADRYVDFGQADDLEGLGSFIAGQPMVQVALYTEPPTGPPQFLGPSTYNSFLLDSGTTGLLTGQQATQELQTPPTLFHTNSTYDEQGVAGTSPCLVSDPYRFDYAGSDGIPYSLNSVRVLASDVDLDPVFGSIHGIAGTPVMVGHNTTVDLTSTQTEPATVVQFTPSPPAGNGHRYDVPLQMVRFPLNGRRNLSDPLPTDTPLALAPVKMSNRGHTIEGHFIVDTGAQVSIISSATAAALGIDLNSDVIDVLPVGGIGGMIDMPLVNTDALSIHTRQGTDLKWTDQQVGVVDIDPSIAGVLGWDVLSNGWPLADGTVNGDFSFLNFDFRNAANLSGDLLFDVDPAHDIVTGSATSWDFNGSGNFSDATRWNSSAVPGGAGVNVTFGNGLLSTIASPSVTVNIDGTYVVGSLDFTNSLGTSYVLAGDGVSGHGITLDNNGQGATVRVAAGVTAPQQIQANLVLADNVTFDIAAGSSLLVTVGGISETGGSRSITLTSGGSLTLGTPSAFSGGTTVNWGTLTTTASGALGSGPLAITAGDGKTSVVNLGGNETLGGLSGSVMGTSTARVSVAAGKSLAVSQSTDASFAGNIALTSGATAHGGGTLTKSGGGALEISGAASLGDNSNLNVTGGTLRFNVTSASSGTVAVGSGVTATVSDSAVLELAGTVSTLSAGGHRVHVVNNGSTPAGLLVSGTNQQVGNIDGTGATQVDDGSDLTANHIIQSALVIGGTASSHGLVTIAASDQSGNPLGESQSSGLGIAGSLEPSGPFGGGPSSSSGLLPLGAVGLNGDPLPAAGNPNSGGGTSPVPEPATIILLALACFVVLTRVVLGRTR